jgi:hypothetical protein
MHPLQHPRNAAIIGIIFLITGAVYWAVPYFGNWHVDYAGVRMLAILGIGLGLMFSVLVAGSSND